MVSIVGSSGVASVDSEELALNVGLEVVNPVDGRDIWMAVLAKGCLSTAHS